ncbi:MAG: hypothetical protein LBF42_01065 [Puniceicoccales bacterium]|jgi:hypothetical protein|nr:hypothetical protein [Puniceicoccales bacterium]
MATEIGNNISDTGYSKFNSGTNKNVSIIDSSNVQVSDKSKVHGTKEEQKIESLDLTDLKRDEDLESSTDGVDNAINNPPTATEKALGKIMAEHSNTAL